MKRIVLTICMLVLSFSCAKYDDIALWNRSFDMNQKIDNLTAVCNKINTNIQSMNSVIKAIQGNDFVTQISPIIENGTEVGYVITFNKSGSITIYHGKDGEDGDDGKDGESPVVSLRQHADGLWYWTVNGEWIRDADGNMICASGKDGITPILKIEGGSWYISYDNGVSWEEEPLGPASGENGDTLIQDITYDGSNIYITLPDGNTLTIPYRKSLKVTFQQGNDIINAEEATIAIQQYIVSTIKIIVENGSEDTFISIHGSKTVNDNGASPSWVIGLNDTDPSSTYAFGSAANLKITSHQKASSASVVIMVSDGDMSCFKELKFRCPADGETLPSYTVTDLNTSGGAANSYIIPSAGTYQFIPTRGKESDPITGVSTVEVLWETYGTDTAISKGDLIKSVSIEDNYIKFSTADEYKEGNAIIAAKDIYGNVLWSWHIWVVEDTIKEQVYPNNAGTFMDRNLGATSCTPGDVGALGLLYQWGRKDPFVASAAINSSAMALISAEWPQPMQSAQGVDIEYSVKHPTTFILCDPYSYDWYYSGSDTNTDNTRWSTEKTIYDPCPAGWQVGDADKWLSAGFSSSSYNTTLRGILLKSGDDEIWLPGAGYIDPFQYKIGGIGYNGSIWMANVDEDGTSAMSIGYSDYRGLDDYKSHSRRASGLSVRCQKSIDII